VRLFEVADRDPDRVALRDDRRERGFGELVGRIHRLARLLRDELGLRPGDPAAFLLGNRIEALELTHAAVLAGIWLTPVNRHLREGEIAYVLRDSGARIVFADDGHADRARAAGAPRVLRVGEELDGALAAVSGEPWPLSGPAGGVMVYTSGTTGRPKGVRRARPGNAGEAFEAQARAGAAVGLDGSGPHLVTGPVYHAAPLLFAVYDQLNGAPVRVMPRFDERALLRHLAEEGVHHTHLVPTMFVRLLRLPEEERLGFRAPELHHVLHGAAPIAPAVKREMIAWWGPILVEYWGGSEGGVTTLVDSREWLARPGTVGRPLPHYEVFAVGEDGERLPPGEVGLLYSRHRALSRPFEYHGAPEKTRSAYRSDGSFTLGDVGSVDGEGYVFLADRASHTIISGGVNIYPAEIEAVLQEHPAVGDVAVFGVPDGEWGETVVAAVEPAPDAVPGETLARALLDFARGRLAGYKVPRRIEFHPTLPRTPVGKIELRALRDPHWRGRARRI